MIMHGGIYNTVGEVVNAVREAQPEKGVVQYHKLVAKPRDGYPGFFELQTRYHIFWRACDYAAVKTDEPGVIVKKEHAASTLPFVQWQTDCTEIVWHCNWGLVDCNQCSRQSFFKKPPTCTWPADAVTYSSLSSLLCSCKAAWPTCHF